MTAINERNWSQLQSGLKKIKQDIRNDNFSSSKKPDTFRHRNSPSFLPRMEEERPTSGDLRRGNFDALPPLSRASSFESSLQKPTKKHTLPNNFDNDIFSPNYAYNPINTNRPVPKKSINNFIKEYKKSPRRTRDSPANINDLAPTPFHKIEKLHNISLESPLSLSIDAVIESFKDKSVTPPPAYRPYNPRIPTDRKNRKYDHISSPVNAWLVTSSRYDDLEWFVDEFIEDFLIEEMIPDLLIMAVVELQQTEQNFSPVPSAVSTRNEDPSYLLTKPALAPQTDRLFHNSLREGPNVLDSLLHETVQEITRDVLLDEMTYSKEPIFRVIIFETMENIVEHKIFEEVYDICREAVFDVILEDYIEKEFIPDVVDEDSKQIAIGLLVNLDTKVESKQKRAVNMYAKEKLMDSFSLEYLVQMIATSGRTFTQSKHLEKLLDEVIISQLLGQYVGVLTNLAFTTRNRPLRRLHEKLVTDVALDAILTELDSQLDEDLNDLHEWETALENPRILQKSLSAAVKADPEMPEGLRKWIKSLDPHSDSQHEPSAERFAPPALEPEPIAPVVDWSKNNFVNAEEPQEPSPNEPWNYLFKS